VNNRTPSFERYYVIEDTYNETNTIELSNFINSNNTIVTINNKTNRILTINSLYPIHNIMYQPDGTYEYKLEIDYTIKIYYFIGTDTNKDVLLQSIIF
jgi:hypothetical protein